MLFFFFTRCSEIFHRIFIIYEKLSLMVPRVLKYYHYDSKKTRFPLAVIFINLFIAVYYTTFYYAICPNSELLKVAHSGSNCRRSEIDEAPRLDMRCMWKAFY